MQHVTVIRAPAGLGKTTVVAQALARSSGLLEYYAPTHALAEEVRTTLQSIAPNLRVNVIGGRSHVGVNGKPLCAKHTLAEELARAGAEVYSALCERKTAAGVVQCEHYAACPYIRQFGPADVTVYTHAHLGKRRTRLDPPVPGIAVIDETFYTSLIDVDEVPLGDLMAPWLDPLAAPVCQAIAQALKAGQPLIRQLLVGGILSRDVENARRAVERSMPKLDPSMDASAMRKRLPYARERARLLALFDTLFTEMAAGRSASQGLVYDANKFALKVHIKKEMPRFHDRGGREARILIIDASANETIIRQWYPFATFQSIAARRNANVTQCWSTRCSTTSLSPARNAAATSKAQAQKRLKQLDAFIKRLAGRHEKVLVVGPQEVTGNPRTGVPALLGVPGNVELAHFNAIRGIDRWRDHDAIVVIGRNQPPVEAAEELARCVYLSDPQPLALPGRWITQPRGYRLYGERKGVRVVVHPDRRVQAVLEQLRECESQQAIDRLRLVHANRKKAVYLLSNIPLDVTVDRLVSWDDLMVPPRLERAWSALPGVMPLMPDWLAGHFPNLWRTSEAARGT